MNMLKLFFPNVMFGADGVPGGGGAPAGGTPPAAPAPSGTPGGAGSVTPPAAPVEGAPPNGGATPGTDTVPISVLKAVRDEKAALSDRLKQLETHFGDQIMYDAMGNVVPRQPQQFQQQMPQQQQVDPRMQLDKLWEDDPRKAVQAELANAISWYDNVSTGLEDQMDDVATKAQDFQQYRPIIRQYLKKLPIDQRSRPGIVEAAYYMFKGQKVDDVIAAERKTIQDRLAAGESIQGLSNGLPATPVTPGGGYTDQEQKIAAVYGQTPEEYWGKRS